MSLDAMGEHGSSRRLCSTHDAVARGPARGRQGDRGQVADPDRVQPAPQGQGRRGLRRRHRAPGADRGLRAADHQGCSTSTGTSATPTPPTRAMCSTSTATPRSARRSTPSPGTTRSGVAPRKGYDNLAYLLYGLRTSLIVASVGHGRLDIVIGVVLGPGRRLLARLAGPGHLVRHRPLPVLPVPARRCWPWPRSSPRASPPTSTSWPSAQLISLISDPGDLRLDGPDPADPRARCSRCASASSSWPPR